MLEDLAVVTGGQVASEDVGLRLEHVVTAQLGSARRVVVAREATTIIEGGGDRSSIRARAEEVELEATTAQLRDGVLEVKLPRKAGAAPKAKKIAVA